MTNYMVIRQHKGVTVKSSCLFSGTKEQCDKMTDLFNSKPNTCYWRKPKGHVYASIPYDENIFPTIN